MKSATVTNVAMTMMNVVMRTCLGMIERIELTSTLLPQSTNAVAPDMATALIAEFVTASAGHSPRSCTNTGFSFHRPRMKSSFAVVGAPAISATPPARPRCLR